MNKILIITVVAVAASMLTGCYQDFEPDLKSTSVVCINSNIIAGQPVTADVTRTWRYSEGDPGEDIDIQIKNAEVSIVVNGSETYILAYGKSPSDNSDDYLYVSDYVAREGDEIAVRAVSPEYGEASGTVTVPRAIKIDNVAPTVSNLRKERSGNRLEAWFDLTFAVTFTDPADAVNYYMFDCKTSMPDRYVDDENIYHSSNEVTISMHPDFSREPLFSEHVGVLEAIVSDTDGYTVFSDRQISGKSYTIHFSIPGCHYVCDDITRPRVSDYVMKLSHISAGYYNYMMSLWATTEGINGILGNVGLGNPVWEHSNVSTGAGIISAAAVGEYHVPFRSLVGD